MVNPHQQSQYENKISLGRYKYKGYDIDSSHI